MKLSIILPLLFFSLQSLAQKPVPFHKIDTSKLFDPKPNVSDYGNAAMFKNTLAMIQNKFQLTLGSKHLYFHHDREIFRAISIHKKEIAKARFFIFTDSSIAFKRIVKIIDILKQSNIHFYRVINYDSYFKPAEVKYQEPTEYM